MTNTVDFRGVHVIVVRDDKYGGSSPLPPTTFYRG